MTRAVITGSERRRATLALKSAMRAAGHGCDLVERGNAGSREYAEVCCWSCSATYRVWDGEPVPHVWSCALHQVRGAA